MIEAEAQAWIEAKFGSAAVDRLADLLALVREEAVLQNLIAHSTMEVAWARHIVDSAQLLLFAPPSGLWLDIGTGAGFPGMVVATLRPEPIVLVEPRQRRAVFLRHAADRLGLQTVIVRTAKVEQVSDKAAIISARAVAPVEKLLRASAGCATTQTRWLLPRGRFDKADLLRLQQNWRGVFHMKQSITDPKSVVLVADGVTAR